MSARQVKILSFSDRDVENGEAEKIMEKLIEDGYSIVTHAVSPSNDYANSHYYTLVKHYTVK